MIATKLHQLSEFTSAKLGQSTIFNHQSSMISIFNVSSLVGGSVDTQNEDVRQLCVCRSALSICRYGQVKPAPNENRRHAAADESQSCGAACVARHSLYQ